MHAGRGARHALKASASGQRKRLTWIQLMTFGANSEGILQKADMAWIEWSMKNGDINNKYSLTKILFNLNFRIYPVSPTPLGSQMTDLVSTNSGYEFLNIKKWTVIVQKVYRSLIELQNHCNDMQQI
jgi:hypothetical protein